MVNDSVTLPIRAAPYQHQIEAYVFVCRLFGIDPGDEPERDPGEPDT